ncbi:MAG: pyruvate synthase subunit beta [Candidatus Aenigmarchaeota archaeon]|nr:pyruvate synthase subunit beta [Candidatus Aenigmarchaeota archaeon]
MKNKDVADISQLQSGSDKDLFYQGHTSCAGCPAAIAIRNMLKATGPNIIISNATSCSEIISSCYPETSWGVPYIHVAFETAAAVASGIEAALKKTKSSAKVIALAGDGGTFDIGFQSLSGMVDRGHDVLYICYSNESYSNTGVQRSSATPYGAWTTTTPVGKFSIGNQRNPKPVAEMMAVQGAPYVATASIGYLKDMERARLAVETGMWVLYEIENGKLTINMEPKGKPVADYLKAQGRFRHLAEKEISEIQRRVDEDWKGYKNRTEI